jgi:hypothetical protein
MAASVFIDGQTGTTAIRLDPGRSFFEDHCCDRHRRTMLVTAGQDFQS